MPTLNAGRSRAARLLGAVAAFAALSLAAGCGGRAGAASAPSNATPSPVAVGATERPSASTRMICAPEAQEDLAKTLGMETTASPVPTWRAHVYACDYGYADGAFTLSVHQLGTTSAARDVYAQLETQLSRRTALQGIGQRATTTANGSVIVQKDHDVLLVDIAQLPARFGVPADTRGNAAISIAATILGCWTGA